MLHRPISIRHARKPRRAVRISKAEVSVPKKIAEHSQSSTHQFFSWLTHGSTKHSYGIGNVRPSVGRSIQQGAYQALIFSQEDWIDWASANYSASLTKDGSSLVWGVELD